MIERLGKFIKMTTVRRGKYLIDTILVSAGAITMVLFIPACSPDRKNNIPGGSDGYMYGTKEYDGLVWMTENIRNVTDNQGKAIEYFIPDNDSSNIINYGLLYDYQTARKVCPDGWHLPTEKEWVSLIRFTGYKSGNDLKDSLFWKTTGQRFSNKSSFSARPSGYGNTGEFENLFGTHAVFWSDTKVDTHFVKGFVLALTSDSMRSAPQHPTYAFSVRCIKNYGPGKTKRRHPGK